MQRMPNDPADPSERLLSTYAGDTSARGVPAVGALASSFGGDPDFFVDWAVPLTDLMAQGVTPTTALVFVMGTSSDAQAIDLDVACSDGAAGPPTLAMAGTDPVLPDLVPAPLPDGGVAGEDGGTGAADGGSGLHLRGGPGACSAASGDGREPGHLGWLLLGGLALAIRRALRRRASHER